MTADESSTPPFALWLFIPTMKRREVARVPRLAESGSLQIPIRPNLARHCAKVVPQIDDRWPAPEPIAVIDAVNDQPRLQHQRMRDHRVVFGVGIFRDIELFLNRSFRVGEEGPLGAH